MTSNVGNIDRIFRFVLGIVLLALPFFTNIAMFQAGAAKYIVIIAGLIMLGTSAMKFCPLYRIFGIRTCKV